MGKLLGIKTTDKEIKKYCEDIEDLYKLGQTKESAVVPKFEALLSYCAKKVGWLLSSEYVISRIGKRPDGAFLDQYSRSHGIMEAKDDDDDLVKEAKNKFDIGYPRENTIFWQPNRIIIYQNDKKVFDAQIGKIEKNLIGKKIEHSADSRSYLAQALNIFFEFEPPHYEQWLEAAEAFKKAVPELSAGLLAKINQSKSDNKAFVSAFAAFRELCQQSINPNISDSAIEEMIIQHLLTERLLRKVFDMDRFTQDNTIARQLEVVISAMTGQYFNRKEFLGSLDGFYKSIEAVAEDIEDFSEKQAFINAIYEKFFQGWAVKSADTLGIVYTPQPVVDFMVRSVGEILKAEFGKTLSSPNVHILDPFVGTGNFIVRVMKEIQPSDLSAKYRGELHCNEIALMPYYIASMNIEHEYLAVNKKYEPFTGICFADTFQMFEDAHYLGFAQAENSERVKKQIEKPIFVVITNPPYNSNQANENDNNKNRKYENLEKEISLTYTKDSKATLKNKLSDPYVKAIKWASKRIGDEGVVAVITNNSYIDDLPFDGMRKHLTQDFDKIYVLDLKGNIRKDSMRDGIPLGEKHTVFGLSAMVGISISFFIRKSGSQDKGVYYFDVPFRSTRAEKFEILKNAKSAGNLAWKKLEPNEQNVWLTEGMSEDFDGFLPVGDKETKGDEDSKTIFNLYSLGVATNRDEWAYNFSKQKLEENIKLHIKTYNSEVERWKLTTGDQASNINNDIDSFVLNDESKIKWTDILKSNLVNKKTLIFNEHKIRNAMYRPFVRERLYFDSVLNQRRYKQHYFFPTNEAESENVIINATCHSQIPFVAQITRYLSCADYGGRPGQCFPFYTYNEDGGGRRENITDWSLVQFRQHYSFASLDKGGARRAEGSENDDFDEKNPPTPLHKGGKEEEIPKGGKEQEITKWDIFHYVYAMLHHPGYRDEYKENLRRSLPRIPFAPDFWKFAQIGKQLANLHVNYEKIEPYPLERIEDREAFADVQFKIKKMKLTADKTQLVYNEAITFTGIPKEVYEYKLGNRSALEWIVDQYQVTTDPRSGITQDPNDFDGDERYIFNLIGRIVAVSLETVKLTNELATLPYKENS